MLEKMYEHVNELTATVSRLQSDTNDMFCVVRESVDQIESLRGQIVALQIENEKLRTNVDELTQIRLQMKEQIDGLKTYIARLESVIHDAGK